MLPSPIDLGLEEARVQVSARQPPGTSLPPLLLFLPLYLSCLPLPPLPFPILAYYRHSCFS